MAADVVVAVVIKASRSVDISIFIVDSFQLVFVCLTHYYNPDRCYTIGTYMLSTELAYTRPQAGENQID